MNRGLRFQIYTPNSSYYIYCRVSHFYMKQIFELLSMSRKFNNYSMEGLTQIIITMKIDNMEMIIQTLISIYSQFNIFDSYCTLSLNEGLECPKNTYELTYKTTTWPRSVPAHFLEQLLFNNYIRKTYKIPPMPVRLHKVLYKKLKKLNKIRKIHQYLIYNPKNIFNHKRSLQKIHQENETETN